jgi:hypothetical protein
VSLTPPYLRKSYLYHISARHFFFAAATSAWMSPASSSLSSLCTRTIIHSFVAELADLSLFVKLDVV